MNEIFDWCVAFLYQMEGLTGISYKALNVWIFVIIQPMIILILTLIITFKNKLNNEKDQNYRHLRV